MYIQWHRPMLTICHLCCQCWPPIIACCHGDLVLLFATKLMLRHTRLIHSVSKVTTPDMTPDSNQKGHIIQICHASVGILMECLPEGGRFSRGRSPREYHPPEGRHSIRIPTLAWHICFIIPNKPQFGKISMKTTMTAGSSSENGGRFAGGHCAGGHDGMANLCKPITAYDFYVRYNKNICFLPKHSLNFFTE